MSDHVKGMTSCRPPEKSNESEIKSNESEMDLINRRDAIDAIDKIFPADPMRNDYTQGITCGAALATEYIKQLPSAQPEPCEDAVSRQAVLDLIADYDLSMGQVVNCTHALPSVQPERKAGIWKNRSLNILYPEWERYECSVCGGYSYIHKYCPNCGARMEDSEDIPMEYFESGGR